MHLRPLGARDRPGVLEAERVWLVEAPASLDRELDRRLVHDPGIDAFQPVVEPAELIDARFFRVERMVVSAAVYAQLLVLRRRAHVGLGVAAKVHRKTAPVPDREHRNFDLVPARAVETPRLGIEI